MHCHSQNRLHPKQPLRYSTPYSRDVLDLGLLFEVRCLGRVRRLLCHLSLTVSGRFFDLVSLVGEVEGLKVSWVLSQTVNTDEEVWDHLRPSRSDHESNVAIVPAAHKYLLGCKEHDLLSQRYAARLYLSLQNRVGDLDCP